MKFLNFVSVCLVALAVTTSPANAGEEYTLGVFPGTGSTETDLIQMMDIYLPMAQYLSKETGAKIKFVPVRIPSMAMKSMADRNGYSLFFGPPVFAAKLLEKGYQPLVVEDAPIRGAFVVNAKSNLKKISDVNSNTKIATPPPELLLTIEARNTLEKLGVSLREKNMRYSASQDALLSEIAYGTSDIAVLRDIKASKVVADNPGKYRIIGYTESLPGFTLIGSKKLPADFLEKVRAAMVKLNNDNSSQNAQETKRALHGNAVVVAKAEDFKKLAALMKKYSK